MCSTPVVYILIRMIWMENVLLLKMNNNMANDETNFKNCSEKFVDGGSYKFVN